MKSIIVYKKRLSIRQPFLFVLINKTMFDLSIAQVLLFHVHELLG